jgi:hypothetical protein
LLFLIKNKNMKRLKDFIVKHNGIIGFIVGVFGTFFAIYVYYFPLNMQPKLKFFLGNQNYFARTDKKIDSLSITYKNRDIRKDSLNLLVTRIRIANKGRGDIQECCHYTSDTFGLRIYNCKIIGVEVEKDKGNHLANKLRPRIIDSATIEMNKLSFNSGEEVIFDVYLLSNNLKKEPDYYAMGRIVGQKEIETLLESEDSSVDWKDDILIPLFVIFIIIIVEVPIVLILGFLITKAQDSYRRNVILKKYDFPLKELNPVQVELVKMYVSLGKKDFIVLLKGFSSGEEFVNKEEEYIKMHEKVNETRKPVLFFKRKLNYNSPYAAQIPKCWFYTRNSVSGKLLKVAPRP